MAPTGIVLVVRLDSQGEALRASRAGVRAGFDAVEITFTVPQAEQVIAQLVAEFPGAAVGAGTVLEPEQVDLAADAGAAFVVAPDTSAPVAERAAARGVAYVPGAFTPTEIQTAHRMGASAVKVFPIRAGGPGYLRELRGPLPHIAYVVSGGLDADGIVEQFGHGASAACVGAGFFGAENLRTASDEALEQIAVEFLQRARGGR
ncbi:bifunctional 4-hydroxy-2-oxoglutarate aldolase/2-dehydro-3-deoxy-phosphogluconate aldolase [Salinibacterium sp. ZJ77]|uniref:bifunctional 4-hydroxy-2-oxoglutarate aldolase/2-dehydro-3-deoxy-phosphogluconate aldolase n=1 Tax=Salinibacterium sp. ZJ77 TaxID=2708337 RepID=UPI0014225D3F|nr:bifunctional 4-hydroxy-2-oxoglutarate aldolase/2-dehydro-3-deoxy-phosphogluconate aldolase [Salinibacterium sp. ZJ77]